MKKIILSLCALSVLIISGCIQKEEPFTFLNYSSSVPTTDHQEEDWWHPSPGLTWQWQLSGEVDLNINVDVFDLDLSTDPSDVEYLQAQGAKVICYISVGSYENWREDANQFPSEVLGKKYLGWPGERWLDIRRIDLLAPIMLARFDECAAKGFDAIEPDNIEIYTNDTGFPITYDDQLQYAIWLANEAHARGLAIGLKNAPDQVEDLVEIFDFAITEDCFYYGWCGQIQPFIQMGKPVFAAEYSDLAGDLTDYCRLSEQLGFSTILKHRDLSSWVETCP